MQIYSSDTHLKLKTTNIFLIKLPVEPNLCAICIYTYMYTRKSYKLETCVRFAMKCADGRTSTIVQELEYSETCSKGRSSCSVWVFWVLEVPVKLGQSLHLSK